MSRVDWIGIGIAITGIAVSAVLVIGCAYELLTVAP